MSEAVFKETNSNRDVEPIGDPREADARYAVIITALRRLAVEPTADPQCTFCEVEPHLPTASKQYDSPTKITGTDKPAVAIRQIADPCIIGDWGVDLEADPLPDGSSPTYDSYTIHTSPPKIIVERHAVDREASGYYNGVVGRNRVYALTDSVADMSRLNKLQQALESVEATLGTV